LPIGLFGPFFPIAMQPTSTPIHFKTKSISDFFPLLARGIQFRCDQGNTIHAFLSQDLELTEEYIQNRIQTIFSNGKAVDDTKNTPIAAGDTVALSAAMPGLVGATFRRGGRYASMRQNVSYQNRDREGQDQNKIITLKLFNLIAKEIGPMVLSMGIYIPGTELADFLLKCSDRFWLECSDIILDNEHINHNSLLSAPLGQDPIFLQVMGS
jgi:hypothetical protein